MTRLLRKWSELLDERAALRREHGLTFPKAVVVLAGQMWDRLVGGVHDVRRGQAWPIRETPRHRYDPPLVRLVARVQAITATLNDGVRPAVDDVRRQLEALGEQLSPGGPSR